MPPRGVDVARNREQSRWCGRRAGGESWRLTASPQCVLGSKPDMAEGRFPRLAADFSRAGLFALRRASGSPRVPVLAALLLAWVAIAAARSGEVPATVTPPPEPSLDVTDSPDLEAPRPPPGTFTEPVPAVFPEPALLIVDGELGARSTARRARLFPPDRGPDRPGDGPPLRLPEGAPESPFLGGQ